MLCSKCSETIKPIVAVDIDGTLGDYHGHFLTFAEQWLGRPIPEQFGGAFFKAKADTSSCMSDTPFKDWMLDVTGIEPAEWRQIKLAYRQGGLKRSMPVYGDAREMCALIRDSGAELWLCTTRPYLRLDNVDPDTRVWLERAGIEYDGLLYDDDKYRLLAEKVDPDRVIAVIDDLPEMCDSADEEFGAGTALLRRNPYNGGTPPRLGSDSGLWSLGRRCENRINDWKEKHHER